MASWLYRYACSMYKTFLGYFERDFELRSAVLMPGNEEVTAEICAALANGEDLSSFTTSSEGGKKVVCTYSYKSTGPYSYYLSDKNPSFPPEHGIAGYHSGSREKKENSFIPPDLAIMMVELIKEVREEDVTERLLPFAGPDGTFHGMLSADATAEKDWSNFDFSVVFPDIEDGDKINITFMNEETEKITYKTKEEEFI
jgi:hypothetical protein